MLDFINNKIVKTTVSVINVIYFAVIAMLTYATFLYDLEFEPGREKSFMTMYIVLNAVFLLLMLFTRNEIVTRVISVVMLCVVFFLVLFNMYDWVFIIPPFIVSVVMFFASGTNETVKVILGTIYLLMYVLGLVAYFVFNMLFGGGSTYTELNSDLRQNDPDVFALYHDEWSDLIRVTSSENLISPDGKYRIVIYDVQNNDKGSVNIVVVPNGEDIKLKFFTLKQKGVQKTISNKGVRGVVPEVGWKVDEDGVMTVVYTLTPEVATKESRVRDLPEKQYFEFLGIS